MGRQVRRSRRQRNVSRTNRQRFGIKLGVEQLEARLVLSSLPGGVDETVVTTAAVSTNTASDGVTLLPLLGLYSPAPSTVASPSSADFIGPAAAPSISTLRHLSTADFFDIQPTIVAGDPAGTPPDSPANREDPNTPSSLFAGVGSLKITVGSSNFTCTATAISPIHALTAAHCLDTNANGTIDTTPAGVTFNINMSGGTSTYQIKADQLYVHPNWTGFNKPAVNDDLAIIELSSPLPANVPIYALNEEAFTDPIEAHFVGYGRSGYGTTDYTTGASQTIKRWGMNVIDSYDTDDEGSGANEVFIIDFDAPTSPESLGNDIETTFGGGDSGGPSFVEAADGSLKVFGVDTFVTQFTTSSPAPPKFGSGAGGIVVSSYLDFIYGVLNGDQVLVTQTDGSTEVAEGGATDSYSLVLATQPSHPVTVNIAGGTQFTVSPAQVTFTPENWNTPQSVTVGAVDDSVQEGPNLGWVRHTVSSADLNYNRATIDDLVVRIIDNDWSLDTTPYVDMGMSDNVAWDQPRVAVELMENADGTRSVGPWIFNTWLLDTGANTTIAFQTAVEDMQSGSPAYRTEGKFIEYGVAGDHLFDISAPYRFDFAGTSGARNTLQDARLISDAENDISPFGPFGIVGMPAMDGRVTTLDFTVWTNASWDDLLMRTEFWNDVPADDGHRYSIPVDTRMTFSPDEQVVEGDYPPMWANVPFLTMIPVHNGVAAGGNFIYDSGAQVSVMSTRLAKEIGLDSNNDGVLNQLDANFARFETVGGIGGTIDAPVFLFDQVHVPTEQGVDIVWTDLQWLVLDIADGLDGVMGFDLMTSGWIEAFAIDGQSGYIMQAQLDFRELGSEGFGTVHLDLNPDIDQVIDPAGPGAKIIQTGGQTTVSEIGVNDTYQIVLTEPPLANVTIALDVDLDPAADQLRAVDAASPSHGYLTFTPGNWNVPQTVLVSAIDDSTIENFHRSSVRHVATSTDPAYEQVGMPRVTVNIIDNDYAGVMIIPTNGSTDVVEGGATDTYDVVLTNQPSQDVTIRLDHAQGQVTAVDAAHPDKAELTFTPLNWNVPQTVLITAVNDSVQERTHKTYVSHIIVTNDTNYQDAFAMQELVTIREAAAPEVLDRRLFYNNSKWDGYNGVPNGDPTANVFDDRAVATDKTALLPGQLASFENYSTFSRGLNGIMIDIIDLPDPNGLTLNDFEFRMGTSNDPASWPLLGLAPSEMTLTVRPGAGKRGSDRVTILFPDGAIANSWLQVKVKATAATGLAAADVHYWGHALGETGDVLGDTLVDSFDLAGVTANPRTVDNPALISNPYDFNRDRLVDAMDQAVVAANITNPNTAFHLLDLRAAGLPVVSVSVAPASVAEDGAANLVYTFTRTGSTAASATVHFRVTGSATYASDYTVAGATSFDAKVGIATFAAGSSTAVVTIDPTADQTIEPSETAWLVVLPRANTAVGNPVHAMGTIAHDDQLQVNQVIIQDGNVQRSIVTQVSVQFNLDVAIAADAFRIINRATGQSLNFSVTTSLVNGKTKATLTFLAGASVYARGAGFSLVDGNYQLTIDATKVTAQGHILDGDKDGADGGNFVFGAAAADKFFRYFGDSDGDRDVDATDYGRLGLTYRKVLGQTGFNRYFDYDDDGDVDATDYGRFSLRYRKLLSFQ